ncbi:MAG: SDR family oxidoreductase, partial [Chloroflexi bacterium]|nr:SDR family oxidoreductase [Chloroflexota bacterium]
AQRISERGGMALAFTADVTDQTAMERVVAEVEQQLGPVTVLVNNAAVLTPLGNDWEVDMDEWWRTMEINVRGAFICTRAVLPRMMSRRQGRIVNVSSIAAHTVHPYGTAYSASKAALTNWTNLLAATVKAHGINVFALSPSGVTEMIETLTTSPNVPASERARFRKYKEEEHNDIETSARMLLFLVSGEADGLTGRHIPFHASPAELVQRMDEIVREDLYALRLRT